MTEERYTLRLKEEDGKCCFNCKHHVFKMMMNITFETGHKCNGICGNSNNDVYYTALEFVCDDYESKDTK